MVSTVRTRIGVSTVVVVLLLTVVASAAKKKKEESSDAEFKFAELAGPLPRTVEADKGPYLVVADLEVPAGKMVTVEAGTVFLFKNFTGLHVQGRLVADGSQSRPIIFTSEFDRDYNPTSNMYPNPYDWNGVYVHKNAIGTSLSYSKVFFSVYGLISDTKFIRIISGVFGNNGKTNLVVEGEEHVVAEGPYTYELSLKDATVDGVPIKILKDPAAPKRNTFRYTGLAILVGGCGMGAYSTYQWLNAKDDLDELSGTDFDNLVNHTSSDWESAKSERNKNRILSFAGYGLGLIGAAGFGWSFTF